MTTALEPVCSAQPHPGDAEQQEDHHRDGAADVRDRGEVEEVGEHQDERRRDEEPARGAERAGRPKSGGNCRSRASIAVMLPAAKTLALTDDDVASSAAIAIIVKPASPSAGSAAWASAVSP